MENANDPRGGSSEPDVKSFLRRALKAIPEAPPPGGAGTGDPLRDLVSALKKASPGFGKERPDSEPPKDPEPAESYTGNEFVDRLIPGAIRGMLETGFPASVAIAQAILESSWGTRTLARDYHNLFALKGKGPAGSVFLSPSGEREPKPGEETEFRRYNHDAESVADFMRMLAESPDYEPVMSLRDQPERFARALTGRYSAMPQYGETLVRIMRQFNLERFDRMRGFSG